MQGAGHPQGPGGSSASPANPGSGHRPQGGALSELLQALDPGPLSSSSVTYCLRDLGLAPQPH